ncbi:FadR/GntR family transcriptional regulator [Agrobacterium larrymoorei]|uniref:FadR family transcriptional regulator n=1 Tax=Agrobacterium larrymoorei TaxID=160699 RepID=A0A4D7DKS3_9HYPH|nr:FadR/GntR family transcriptional regulator [Agrobacterium larrymoorei]QCI96671.1 FadR family transcriptional regulator [Agrobacterium larrymoorei]QYA07906.1 FadR family transcriptional regulator [Agrobacterium larrymoorei]
MNGQAKIIEPRRLYQQVADQIRELIEGGEFQPGTRLPAERELAQKLGVSRPSLREALIALEIDGSVDIRMGSGVYVLPEQGSQPTRTKSLGESPSELMQARSTLEGATILLAASRIDAAALSALRSNLDEMRGDIEAGRKPLDQDRKFHTIIAEQSGNSVLARLVADLFDERHSPISAQLRVKFEDKDTWAFALQEHEAILAALEAKDPLLAQAAMHIHLESSRRRWIDK